MTRVLRSCILQNQFLKMTTYFCVTEQLAKLFSWHYFIVHIIVITIWFGPTLADAPHLWFDLMEYTSEMKIIRYLAKILSAWFVFICQRSTTLQASKYGSWRWVGDIIEMGLRHLPQPCDYILRENLSHNSFFFFFVHDQNSNGKTANLCNTSRETENPSKCHKRFWRLQRGCSSTKLSPTVAAHWDTHFSSKYIISSFFFIYLIQTSF